MSARLFRVLDAAFLSEANLAEEVSRLVVDRALDQGVLILVPETIETDLDRLERRVFDLTGRWVAVERGGSVLAWRPAGPWPPVLLVNTRGARVSSPSLWFHRPSGAWRMGDQRIQLGKSFVHLDNTYVLLEDPCGSAF